MEEEWMGRDKNERWGEAQFFSSVIMIFIEKNTLNCNTGWLKKAEISASQEVIQKYTSHLTTFVILEAWPFFSTFISWLNTFLNIGTRSLCMFELIYVSHININIASGHLIQQHHTIKFPISKKQKRGCHKKLQPHFHMHYCNPAHGLSHTRLNEK